MPALGTVNLPTKFQISISTHYDDTKGDTNVEMGWFGVVRMTQGHWK